MPGWPNTVSIGGFVADVADGSSLRVVTGLTGWDDGAPARSSVQARSQQNGGWDASGLLGPRVITVEGSVQEQDGLSARATADALSSLSPSSSLQFTVANTYAGSRSAMVRVSSAVVLSWLSPATFRYTIELTAPDPVKYGAQDIAGLGRPSGSLPGTGRKWPRTWRRSWGLVAPIGATTVALANAGTAAYWPTLRLNGGATNPVVQTGPGDWLRVGYDVPEGSWVDVDCGSRSVLLNGETDLRGYVSVADSGSWLAVPPGGASLSWSADASTAAGSLVAVYYEGAWT